MSVVSRNSYDGIVSTHTLLYPAVGSSGDLLSNGEIQLLVITSAGDELDQKDGRALRRLALAKKVGQCTVL